MPEGGSDDENADLSELERWLLLALLVPLALVALICALGAAFVVAVAGR